VPGTVAVLGALVNGNLGRHSRETEFVFNEAIDHWRAELQVDGADVDVHLIEVDLASLADTALRDRVLSIPTAFRISDDDQKSLVLAARASLAASREFERFMHSVAVGPTSSGSR
jgi:NTE family protein